MHFLYPEGDYALSRVKDDPAHLFFKQFGESMPKGAWNHPGTKQGVYMIGPNAEYLEGGGAISGDADVVAERLTRALARWAELRKEKKYANKPVPLAKEIAPPETNGKPLVLRVFLRDLPRREGDQSGRRFTKADLRGMWLDFTKWAWNINWIAFDDPKIFVTQSEKETPVASSHALRLFREVLVDNVRGQSPRWEEGHVKVAEFTMKRKRVSNGRWHLEYQGKAEFDSGAQRYAPTLYGTATFDPKKNRFERFELLAIGDRAGRGPFNQRERDQGPAPMGIAIVLPD